MSSDSTERKLAAIMIADIVGYSRMMGRDETKTFERLCKLRDEVTHPLVVSHAGRVIKTTGDGFLAEFSSANAAVKGGIAIQEAITVRESSVDDDQRLRLRIGIHLGDIIIDGDDVAGDGVNIAARLETLSKPDGLCISAAVREQIRDKLNVQFSDLGEKQLKNIDRPIRAYSVTLSDHDNLSGFSVDTPVRGFGGKPALAVLPFDNMSNDPEQAYFADGIAEDILTRLAMWRWLPVIGRNSSFAYRGKSVDLKKVGTELGARYILEGSVRKSGNKVRITGQLIDAETGHHVWAHKYDRVLDDIFVVQDEITEAIVTALEPAVGHAERNRANHQGTSNLDAWDVYYRAAWHYSQHTKESLNEAYRLCLVSAELDQGFATPLAGAAFSKLVGAMFAWNDPVEAFGDAYRLATEARRRDPLDPFALAALGGACATIGQYDAAIENSLKAVELNPSGAAGYSCLGYALLVNGQFEEAVAAYETCIRISPNDNMLIAMYSSIAEAHFMCGQSKKAEQIARLGIQRAPNYPQTYRSLAIALGQLNRADEGRHVLKTYIDAVPSPEFVISRAAIPYRHDADYERFVAGYRKLGWPDHADL